MHNTVFLGPPGTGKTTSLLDVVQQLFYEDFLPHEIAVVSFTKKASNEVKGRAKEQFPDLPPGAWGYWNTLHSVCFHRLKLNRADVMGKDNWNEISKKTGLEMKGYYDISDGALAGGTLVGDRCLFHNGLAKAKMLPWEKHYETLTESERYEVPKSELGYFVETLNLYKQEKALSDFDDMLEHAIQFGPIPNLKVAIIDEAQDLSLLQWTVALTLFADCQRMYIAGDDDQAIFEWSGADVRKFISVATGAQRIVLDHSWRVPPQLQKYADRIINRIPSNKRFAKFWTPAAHSGNWRTVAEFQALFEALTADDGKTWLLLARNNYFLEDYKKALIAWGVPFSVKGKPNIKPEHITAIRFYEQLRKGGEIMRSEAQLVYRYLLGNGKQIQRGFKELPGDTPEMVNYQILREKFGLDPKGEFPNATWFETFQRESMIRTEDKDYIRRILRHGGHLIKSKPKLNLSTIHGEKGGEADNVILIDQMSPRSYREYKQVNPIPEHRVQYVAVTRARENLFLLQVQAQNAGMSYAD
jgi:DNA helicase-2/ATP-dependent DNA helicase PcrA